MSIAEFVDILRKGGLKFYKIEGHFFQRHEWKQYLFPPWIQNEVTKRLIRSIRWRFPVSVILTDFKKKNTYEFILETDDYSLSKFKSVTRNRIKRSLQTCNFRRPEVNDMLTDGLDINKETCLRQNRKDPRLTDYDSWRKTVLSLDLHKGAICLGAYYADRMVGYLVVVKLGEKHCIQYGYISRADSEVTSPMNGLIYTLVNNLLKEEGIIKLSYGLDSIKPMVELNRFKSNMLFCKVPVTRAYIIHPLLLPWAKFVIFIQIRILKKHNFTSPALRELVHIYYGHRLLAEESKAGNLR